MWSMLSLNKYTNPNKSQICNTGPVNIFHLLPSISSCILFHVSSPQWASAVAHLWLLWWNVHGSGCGSSLWRELSFDSRWGDRLLFRRDLRFCGWCRFALSLFIPPLHQGQFGAGFGRGGALPRGRTNHVLWDAAPATSLGRAAGARHSRRALSRRRGQGRFIIAAFASLRPNQ